MRALLTPEIAPRMGVVLLRPGADLMPMFMRGRVLIEPAPENTATTQLALSLPPRSHWQEIRF